MHRGLDARFSALFRFKSAISRLLSRLFGIKIQMVLFYRIRHISRKSVPAILGEPCRILPDIFLLLYKVSHICATQAAQKRFKFFKFSS